MGRTRRRVLWTLYHRSGSLMALRANFQEGMVLPMFSSPFRCEAWIMNTGAHEDVFPSPPLARVGLRNLLEYAQEAGFTGFTIDPPLSFGMPVEVADIDDLLDQVEQQLEWEVS